MPKKPKVIPLRVKIEDGRKLAMDRHGGIVSMSRHTPGLINKLEVAYDHLDAIMAAAEYYRRGSIAPDYKRRVAGGHVVYVRTHTGSGGQPAGDVVVGCTDIPFKHVKAAYKLSQALRARAKTKRKKTRK